MNNVIHFLNGKFVTEDELVLSPRDLGFTRGYAVADFIVTHNQKPFKLIEHIDRLFHSASLIGLRIPWNKEQITAWVKETLDKNDKDTELTIKILLSGGISSSMYQAEIPTIVMIVNAYVPPPTTYYEKGVKVKAVPYKRHYPEAKHTQYVEAIRQLAQVNEDTIEEILYYDDTQVFEGAGSNLFAVINNTLVTPKSNIVYGITRNTLLEILHLPIPIEIRDFTFDSLMTATEVFLTGSSKGVRGVTHINKKVIADGNVGDITKEVMKQYKEYTQSDKW
ncbi:MAG: aminotransferase class IV [Candidatus Levybacteria bacterium]|nr:aminotransferase class IV [Candidatus Levybacteria bacterium]